MLSEKDLQNAFCNLLQKNGFEYFKKNIKVEDLEPNFKTQVENFNQVTLTDGEFLRIKNSMFGNMAEAFENLRHGVQLIRDDNTNITIKFFNPHDSSQNVYQVAEEITINGVRDRRLDVILLINGLPIVALELKKQGNSHGVTAAISDINTYTKEGIYRTGLLRYIQIYVASDNLSTKYFSTSIAAEHGVPYNKGFYWTDKDNNRILKLVNNTVNVTNTMLTKDSLNDLIWLYMLKTPAPLSEIFILRPYQIYAIKEGIKRSVETNKNGFFWHATGSGKTLTSYILAKTLKENPKHKKVILLLDRNDLADQTINEYQKFGLPNTQTVVKSRQLKAALEDDTVELVITTIQSFNKVSTKYTKGLKKLSNSPVCFIIDECHRSTFGKMFKTIKRIYKQAQFLGFTGTPRLAENATANDILTKDIFGEPIHIYTTKNAIDDRNVLAFELHEVNLENTNKEVHHNREYYLNENRINEISEYINTNFWKHTSQKYPKKNPDYLDGYTAMLATQNINTAYKYWQELTPRLQKQGRTTAVVFSIANKAEETVEGEGTAETWFPEIIEAYDKTYQTNFTETLKNYGVSETRKQHLTDVMARVKNKEIDLIIVSDMLLTGFDAPTLNTIYLDKKLEYHNLLQAMSRTNRLYNRTNKQTGNVIIFSDREMVPAVNATITLYSNNQNVDGIILKRDYKELYFTVINQIEEMVTAYPEPELINNIDEISVLAELASFYSGLNSNLMRLQTYDQWEPTTWNTFPVKEQKLQEYYASIINKKEDFGLNNKEEESDEWLQLEFAITEIRNATIDAAYINNLLRQGIYAPEREKKKWFNRVIKAINLSTDPQVLKTKTAILEVAKNYKEIRNENDLWGTIEHYRDIETKTKYQTYSKTFDIPVNHLQEYVTLYEKTESIPIGEIDIFLREKGKGLQERKIIRTQLTTLIKELAR